MIGCVPFHIIHSNFKLNCWTPLPSVDNQLYCRDVVRYVEWNWVFFNDQPWGIVSFTWFTEIDVFCNFFHCCKILKQCVLPMCKNRNNKYVLIIGLDFQQYISYYHTPLASSNYLCFQQGFAILNVVPGESHFQMILKSLSKLCYKWLNSGIMQEYDYRCRSHDC